MVSCTRHTHLAMAADEDEDEDEVEPSSSSLPPSRNGTEAKIEPNNIKTAPTIWFVLNFSFIYTIERRIVMGIIVWPSRV